MNEIYSARCIGRPGNVHDGRAILPRSALQWRANLICKKEHRHVGPLIFRVYNQISGRTSHTAAQSFTAEEGTIILPQWMLDNLDVQNNEELIVQRACLPYATSCELESFDTVTASLEEQKYLLNQTLSRLCCLTTGDTLQIRDSRGKFYKVAVMRTGPEDAVNVTACNLQEMVASIKDEDDHVPTYDRDKFLQEAAQNRDKSSAYLEEKPSDTKSFPIKVCSSTSQSKTSLKECRQSTNTQKSENKGFWFNIKTIFTKCKSTPKELDEEELEEDYEPPKKIKHTSKPIDFQYINRNEEFVDVEYHDVYDPSRFEVPSGRKYNT